MPDEAPSPYDKENIFAKIIDGDVPSFKVFENKYVLAILDAFPMTKGHTLVLPKMKGYKSLLDMPDNASSDFMYYIPKISRAVKEATGADGINLISNMEPASGQMVFHPHVHIVPRYTGDELLKFPPSAKEMLAPDAANPVVASIKESLNKSTLRKAKQHEVGKIKPGARGLNLTVQVIDEPKEAEGHPEILEIRTGDATGSVTLSVEAKNGKDFKTGDRLDIRNAFVKMINNHIRVSVDKWGKLLRNPNSEVVADTAKPDVSKMEYELVK